MNDINQRHYGYLAINEEFLSGARTSLIKGELWRLIPLLIVTTCINFASTYINSQLLFILQIILVTATLTRLVYTLYSVFAIKHMGIKQITRAAGLDGAFVEEVSGGLLLQTSSITSESLNACAEILTSIYNKYPEKLPIIKIIKEWIFSENILLRIKAVIYTEVLADQLEGGNTLISVEQDKLLNFDTTIATNISSKEPENVRTTEM